MQEASAIKMLTTRVCKCCGRELPISNFKTTKIGRLYTCSDCMRKKQSQGHAKKKMETDYKAEVEKARTMRLQDFTPRELMKELKNRGYKFTMEYVETHIINSKDL